MADRETAVPALAPESAPELVSAAPAPAPTADALRLLIEGGPVIWIISALSVIALTLLLWKIWRFASLGVWRRARAEEALDLWAQGARRQAQETAQTGRGVVSRVLSVAMAHALTGGADRIGREETERAARAALVELRAGLRGLEVIVTIAPLLGLLGTVLGMIEAFQALQASGGRADPGQLAGGIWEALLTTAAGMAVAIPAGVALSWCESVVESARARIEDAATRVFTAAPTPMRMAAE